MSASLTHLVAGPERHGVVRFGLQLHAALQSLPHPATLCRTTDGWAGDTGVHVQFTDRLFGDGATAAAAAITRLADRVHRLDRRMTVTLHDVPQPSDGAHHAERTRAYADVCAAADGIVVCSEHERHLLDESGIGATRSSVIPLPVDHPASLPARRPLTPSVGIFGYLYPGKGHLEVLEAMTGLPPEVPMVAIGEPSAGHHDLVDQLSDHARLHGRRFTVTGHVPDEDLTAVLRDVSVPVAHHRHVSASGSLNAWLAAGRRPLAPRSRYTDEVTQRNPDCLTVYPDDRDGLRAAIAAALADPESTWLPNDSACEPTVHTTALRYAEVLTGWHR